MKKNITFFLIITQFSAFAQISADYEKLFPNSLTNNELGFNKDRLNIIENGFQELISKEQIPGAVALVVRNGKVVYEKAFGISDPKTNRAYKIDDIFRIASMSKAITSTAAMILYEQGKFNLDDPISKWSQAFKNITVL
jgi:CubicO group peptidase (beta-lactamase class C family)